MIIVRLDANIVVEILPNSTYEKGPLYWFGYEIAEQCVSAPDNVVCGMTYENGVFYWTEKKDPERTPEQRILELEQDNLIALEALTELYEIVTGGL
jgi:hypothetical protein